MPDPIVWLFVASIAIGLPALSWLWRANASTSPWKIVLMALSPFAMLGAFYSSLVYEDVVASRLWNTGRAFEHWRDFEGVRQAHGAFVVLATFLLTMFFLWKRREGTWFKVGAAAAVGALMVWLLALVSLPFVPG